MLKAWRYRATCRDPGRPGAWMAAIVRQEAHRAFRRRPPAPAGAATEPHAPDVLGGLAERVDVQRAMSRLGADDRRLLWLRYAEDQTQPAAAAALGIPEGTAKVRLHRLRRRLSEELGAA